MPIKVLTVDDTKTVLMTERMMLSGQGYEVSVATNGREALRAISEDKPDLILLDIVMEEMDGIECCRRIKSDPNARDIPVIMVTTRGEPESVNDAFRAGCDDYITKPIDKLELLTKIRELLA